PVPTSTPSGVQAAECGTSSGELQSVSTSPDGRIRRSAPFGGACCSDPAAPGKADAACGAAATVKLSVTVTSAPGWPVVVVGGCACAGRGVVSGARPSIAVA